LLPFTIASSATPLESCPFPRLLADIAGREATGTLSLESGNLKKSIRFLKGVPAQVESNIASESLERFLVDRGELAESVAQKALASAASEDKHVGEVLVHMRAVEPNDLFVALKRSLGKSILSVFVWERGSSHFDEGEFDINRALLIKVKPAPLILRGVCNFTPIHLIQRDFGENLDKAHRLVDGGKQAISQLHTSTKESRIVNAIRHGRTLTQLSQELGGDHELILRILYALSLLGLSEICAQQAVTGPEPTPPHEPAPPSEPEPAPPSEPEPPFELELKPEPKPEPKAKPEPTSSEQKPVSEHQLPTVNFAAQSTPPRETTPSKQTPTSLSQDERNELDAAYLMMKTRDYFEFFGLKEEFSFEHLKEAFLEKCNRFSPMSYQSRDLGDQEERAEELFFTMIRAFSVLAVPASRSAYRQENQRLKTPAPEPTQAKRRNAYSIITPDDVPTTVQSGLELLAEGELSLALACLRGAYEANPKDAYTCAFLGYFLYMADPISKMQQALKLLNKATQLDPTLAYPFLLLGRVAEFQQDRIRALQAYQDCLAIDPLEAEAEEATSRLQRFVRKG
jgi:hypothetical protein